MSVAHKIDGLMARALHEQTPVEEARTCAMLAVKLIHSSGILTATRRGAPSAPPSGPRATRPEPAHAPEWRCDFCGRVDDEDSHTCPDNTSDE